MDSLLSGPGAAQPLERYGRAAVKEEFRRAIADGETTRDGILARAGATLARRFSPRLRRVVNATGILLHTNLGRAPLGLPAREALAAAATGYATLEYDPDTGERGHRQDHVRGAIRDLFGGAEGIAVNNNASAIFLALSTIARGRRTLVSRGELVAIGGSFRIPEILETSGALLTEVGTTNRTTIADYRRALGPEVALLLTVHPSNYEIRGYTQRPLASELRQLAKEARIPWLHDQGTGCVVPLDEFGVPGEPTVSSCLADGADLVSFSADKLFGGPQAGFLVGRAELVERAAAHPVARVVRPDKLTFAALAATLADWKTGHWRALPIYRAAAADISSLEARGESIRDSAGRAEKTLRIEVAASQAFFGGGTSPEKPFASRALRVSHRLLDASTAARRLREREIPIIGRVENRSLWLDLRSIAPEEDSIVADALAAIAAVRESSR
ncbi:MAG TPA: L-seryl-tRNA(Sec) selenium transferase [Thermoanaerobaculia bacterium]